MVRKIGFIGTGVMGRSMIRNLKKNGFEVQIYSRTKEKAEERIAEGIPWKESVGECARGQDAVIMIVGYPQDVEEVCFSENGILEKAAPGTILIDMATSSPVLTQRICRAAKDKGMEALDAPVSGGDSGAKAGTLSIMAGSGQHTKMANQIALSGALAGACEESAGFGADLPVLRDVLHMFEKLDAEGSGDLGTQALIKYYV